MYFLHTFLEHFIENGLTKVKLVAKFVNFFLTELMELSQVCRLLYLQLSTHTFHGTEIRSVCFNTLTLLFISSCNSLVARSGSSLIWKTHLFPRLTSRLMSREVALIFSHFVLSTWCLFCEVYHYLLREKQNKKTHPNMKLPNLTAGIVLSGRRATQFSSKYNTSVLISSCHRAPPKIKTIVPDGICNLLSGFLFSLICP